ncbi:N-6 DNA methylase [Pseudomonas soli]|uniref:class I SAM-dependent DNA methyltransferase n=1 Tax=Pseudomonas soli TaxID=1306993 RepID=UPI00299E6DFF|nr:N-6 DNA methylase [Pseudomonas soli]MDW9401821.1 N-6 DNA methylase [Pseudomonas soli]
MAQLENIEAIEKRLWSAADTLRANSNYAANEYFMPVMGLIFLRHAYSRYLAVKDDIIASLPSRGGKTREVTKEDFSQRGAIYLQPHAQFDTLVGLPDSADRAQALISAMESIEADYSSLAGVLPKAEYQQLENSVLGQLLRTLNPEELKKATGDIFGRIYEYFLTAFADVGAHDGGEFFTPVSLVRMITNIIEPNHGKVLDPACGSGGMFVQSAHFVGRLKQNPSELLTFYGAEKNTTTIRLAKMNLAVHGLSGDIQKAISYYEDPHELLHKADFVMANPPFNVDEVDAEAVKNDPRLPFGLPGVNKGNKVSNGNYLWISYFYSYLNDKGRAGFVMSSQASSAGRDEARVRQKLVGTGHVDAMVAIRSNFFYTRTVPCELWFFDKAKPTEHKDHVLMLDARDTYRKVTRKIYDFAPEQLANLTAIIWLYRGEQQRFLDLVAEHLGETVAAARDCGGPLIALRNAIDALTDQIKPAICAAANAALSQSLVELESATTDYCAEAAAFDNDVKACNSFWHGVTPTNALLLAAGNKFKSLAEHSRDLIKDADQLYKLANRLIEDLEKVSGETGTPNPAVRELNRSRKAAEESRRASTETLKKVRHYWKAAHWLQEKFPAAELRDIPGLVKRVSLSEIAANDWSLTPGRYVGVAPEEQDDDFDFEQALRDIHIELQGLNEEATELAVKIAQNFLELGA